jgi:hypothetical protein
MLAVVTVAVVSAVAITADVGVGLLPHRGVGVRFGVGVDCLAIPSLPRRSTLAAVAVAVVFAVAITADVGVGLLPDRGVGLRIVVGVDCLAVSLVEIATPLLLPNALSHLLGCLNNWFSKGVPLACHALGVACLRESGDSGVSGSEVGAD